MLTQIAFGVLVVNLLLLVVGYVCHEPNLRSIYSISRLVVVYNVHVLFTISIAAAFLILLQHDSTSPWAIVFGLSGVVAAAFDITTFTNTHNGAVLCMAVSLIPYSNSMTAPTICMCVFTVIFPVCYFLNWNLYNGQLRTLEALVEWCWVGSVGWMLFTLI